MIFAQAQMDQHAVFLRAVHSRQAVVSKAANAAASSGDSGSEKIGIGIGTGTETWSGIGSLIWNKAK